MKKDPLQGTGFNTRSPNDRIRTGAVIDANVGEGTVRVKTRSGEVLDRVRVMGTGNGPAGTGLMAMPLPRTPCVVLSQGAAFEDHVLLGTYAPLSSDQKSVIGSGSDLLPGMLGYWFEDGGHVQLHPSGMVDIKAHPWAHRTYVPREHLIKEHVRQFEQVAGPHDLFRRISSTEEESSVLELMVNDRFLYRDGDTTPPIIWTLGDATRGNVSPYNPGSAFRHYYQVEHRPRSDAEPQARHTEEIGLVDGVVSRETLEPQEVKTRAKQAEKNNYLFLTPNPRPLSRFYLRVVRKRDLAEVARFAPETDSFGGTGTPARFTNHTDSQWETSTTILLQKGADTTSSLRRNAVR